MVVSTQTWTSYLYNFYTQVHVDALQVELKKMLEIGNNHLEQEVEQIFGKPVAHTTGFCFGSQTFI